MALVLETCILAVAFDVAFVWGYLTNDKLYIMSDKFNAYCLRLIDEQTVVEM